VVQKVVEALNRAGKPMQRSKICILGVAYKKDVDDCRESPSFVLMEMLLAGGALLSYNDPHVPRISRQRHREVPELTSVELTPEFLAQQDCLVVATDHSTYNFPDIVRHSQLVIDTRNATHAVTEGRWKICKA
jgi:UDP-N-acetyl-D-glucosamine dehydrogenase